MTDQYWMVTLIIIFCAGLVIGWRFLPWGPNTVLFWITLPIVIIVFVLKWFLVIPTIVICEQTWKWYDSRRGRVRSP